MLYQFLFRGIDLFGWSNDLHTRIHKLQPNSVITLTFRSYHETLYIAVWALTRLNWST